MNERIEKLAKQAGFSKDKYDLYWDEDANADGVDLGKFAELIAADCASICMELATKCAGLPNEGALAVDCANLIKQDFGVEE